MFQTARGSESSANNAKILIKKSAE